MTEKDEMVSEICKEYSELKPKYRLEFLDFCIDFWKGKIPEKKLENLKGLREHEKSEINN